MLKWLREHLRIILIIYTVGAGCITVTAIVFLFKYGLDSIFLLFVGLFQLFVGIWILKRLGKGLLG